MRLLICTSEYPPDHSAGIGNVAYNVVGQLKEMGVDCIVCSPNADVKLGKSRMFKRFGIIGLLYYWHQISRYFKGNVFDIVWTILMRDFPDIAQFKVIQERIDLIRVQIVKGKVFSEETINQVKRDIKNALGDDVYVETEIVDKIPKEESGKVRSVVSKVKIDWNKIPHRSGIANVVSRCE